MYIKKIAILIMLIMSVSMLFSCGKNNDSDLDDYTDDGALKLMSFESNEELLQSVAFSALNSKIELNTDKSYITEGEKSVRMRMNQVLNDKGYYDNSVFQLLCNTKYLKRKNYNDIDYFGIDIFNNSEFEVEFLFTAATQWYFPSIYRGNLKPGINRLQIYADKDICDFSEISFFSFAFKGGEYNDGYLDIYVDNFRAFLTETTHTPYNRNLDDGIIYRFDNSAEASKMWVFGNYESMFSIPTCSINRNPAYILTGNGSLKVDFYRKRDGAMDSRGIRTEDNSLGDLNKYLGQENYYITFDIYNPYLTAITCSVKIFSNYNDETYSLPDFMVSANSWADRSTTRIYLNALKEHFTGSALNILTITFTFNDISSPGSVYFDNISIKK